MPKHPGPTAARRSVRLFHEQVADNDLLWHEMSKPFLYVRDDKSGAWLEYRSCRVCDDFLKVRPAELFVVEYLDEQLPTGLYLGPLLMPSDWTLAQLADDAILQTLKRTEGNVTTAARWLGVDKSTIYLWCRRHGVRPTGGRKRISDKRS